MSRAAVTYPSKEELRAMSTAELTAYIDRLSRRLELSRSYVKEAIEKHLAVAEKVREIRLGKDAAGEP